MEEKHKKYILENICSKSVQEIARELNLKERKIRKFIERHREQKKQISPETEPASGPKELRTPLKKKTVLLSVLLIIILGFVVYGNSLNGEFIWDDEYLVETNVYIRNFSHIPEIFTQDIMAGSVTKSNSYRPLQVLTYLIDYSLWKLNVRGYHLTNILLHTLAALSVYWLLNIIFQNNLLSLLAGIFFVIHPVHTEAVTYISGRADPLALLFMLLCFIFYIKSPPSKSVGMYVLILLSYTLALLSRENSLILPVLLLLYHYSFKKELKVKEFFSILILALIYILLRITIWKTLVPGAPSPPALFQRLPGFFVAVTSYIRLLFCPFDLHMEYGSKLFDWGDLRTILGAVMVFALLFYAFKRKESNKLVFFSISWFFITLLPVSNLYPVNAYMAEHWLYLPSVGFFLIAAKTISSLYRVRRLKALTTIFVISLLVFYSCLTIRQNVYWRELLSFYERTLKYAPRSPRVHNNLGRIYNSLNQREKAVASFKKAVEINRDYAEPYYNLGWIYNAIDKKEEAIAAYQKAIKINPEYVEAYRNLGIAYNEINRNEEAVALYTKAIAIKPDYSEAHYNLGNAYKDMNRLEDAMASYQSAIKLRPDYVEAHYNLGNIYKALDKREEAISSYKKAIEIKDDHVRAYTNLGLIYVDIGEKEKAVTAYKKAIEIKADYADAYNNLGVVYVDMNRNEEAITAYKKAIKLKPEYAQAYNNLGLVYAGMNKSDQAVSAYRKAITIKPDYAKAHNNLGRAYAMVNQNEEAVASFKKAVEINPKYAAAYDNLSVIHFQIKQYKLAVEYFDKANALGLKNPALLEALKLYKNLEGE